MTNTQNNVSQMNMLKRCFLLRILFTVMAHCPTGRNDVQRRRDIELRLGAYLPLALPGLLDRALSQLCKAGFSDSSGCISLYLLMMGVLITMVRSSPLSLEAHLSAVEV